MKLSARDISAFLSSPLKRSVAVLLYGPDDGLIREHTLSLRTHILGQDCDPLNVIELSGEQLKDDPAILADELSALSLMGGQRLVILRDGTDAICKIIESALTEISNPTAYFIALAGDLPPRSALRKFFESGKNIAALPCYRDDERKLPQLVRSTLSAAGLEVSADAIQYLCTQLGNDRAITMSELEKIILYMGEDKQVTLDIVQELVGDNSELALDDLSHAVAGGDIAALHRAFSRHLQEGIAPVGLIRAVMRYFFRLQQARAWVDNGLTAEAAAKKLHIFFKQLPAFKSHLQRWNYGSLNHAQTLLLQAECAAKSGVQPIEPVCERFFIRVSKAGGTLQRKSPRISA